MSQEGLTEGEFVELLKDKVNSEGGLTAFSVKNSIPQDILHNVLSMAVSPGSIITKILGYRKQTFYVKVDE